MSHKRTLKTIQKEIEQLEVKAKKLEQAEKAGMDNLRALLPKYRLTPTDLKLALNYRGARYAAAGRNVKPKYRNPQNKSETWTGRGRSRAG